MKFDTKVHYNLIIKLMIGIFILNVFLTLNLLLLNLMFYNKNYSNVTQNVTQTVMIDNKVKTEKININNCSFEALKNLKGIGDKKARDIISSRPYKDVYELKKVIGTTTFENIKNYITV